MEPDNPHLPGQRDTQEAALRADFTRAFRLLVAADFARSEHECEALLVQAEHLAENWLRPNDEWSRHWLFLEDVCDRFRYHPLEARQELAGINGPILDPDPVVAATKMAGLQQAFTLDTEYRAATAAPRAVDTQQLEELPYTATYTAKDQLTVHGTFTSWWRARKWIRDNTYTHPSRPATIEITGRDNHTGNQHALTAADDTDPTALRAELTRLDRLLGGRRQSDGKPWLDELCADILVDEYRENFAAQLNPWEVRHRFEHQLRADDLRDQYVDFAVRAEIPTAADPAEAVDDALYARNLYAAEPTDTSWLDDIVTFAEQLPGQLKELGVDIRYQAPDDPAVTIAAGWSVVHGDKPWYAEVRITQEDGGWIGTGECPSGRYATCGELITALQQYGTDRPHPADHSGMQPVPSEVAARLWGFDSQLTELADDITTTKAIRSRIRAREPYQLTCSRTETPGPDSRKQTTSPARDRTQTEPSTPQDQSKTVEQNRQRAHQRRQRANRQPQMRTPPRRRRP